MTQRKLNIGSRISKWVKSHKVLSCSLLAIVLVAGIGVTAFGVEQAKLLKTKAALSQLDNGIISAEDAQDLELNTELIKDNGEVVVLTQNADGTVTETVVRDASGNNTGAVVPTPGGGSQGGGVSPTPSPTPTPVAHTHTWVPHTTIVHHDAVYQTKWVGHTHCNVCGAIVDGLSHGQHGCNGGHYSTYASEEPVQVLVQDAYNQEVIDYYYCSECGARQ